MPIKIAIFIIGVILILIGNELGIPYLSPCPLGILSLSKSDRNHTR